MLFHSVLKSIDFSNNHNEMNVFLFKMHKAKAPGQESLLTVVSAKTLHSCRIVSTIGFILMESMINKVTEKCFLKGFEPS